MSDGVTAVQYGVGPIGSRIVSVANARGIEFVGAVDVDPEKAGRDLGDVAGLDAALGVTVTEDAEAALDADPDVVFHSTASSLAAVEDQLAEAMAAGADVVSTTEELSYPWRDNATVAESVDETAREAGATLLGTGINPGFAMDTLPAVLSTPCQSVDFVSVTRVQDAGTRRKPLQEKVGAGTSLERFESEVAPDAGHVGLPESVAMIAAGMGWELSDVRETVEPVVAKRRVQSDYVTVEPGEVAGIHQVGRGLVDGDPVLELDLSMYVGAENPRDVVELTGEPDLTVSVDGGFHGDVTTPAIVVNAVERVREAEPGLQTMLDLATPRYGGRY
ncbi:MAG: hypothetical protein ABEJ22_04215 [Haloferacaceae archaeon]